MNILGTSGLALFLVVSCFGQFGNVVFPGRGGSPPPGVNPWGNVVFPGTGHAPRATPFSITDTNFANRLGGSVSGARPYGSGERGGGRRAVYIPYAFPTYLSGSYYGSGYGTGDAYPPQQAPNVTVIYPPQQTPVIVNQTFVGDSARPVDPNATEAPGQPSDTVSFYQAPSRGPSEQPASRESVYYLIAFKDHSIYSAVAYWVDGETLHYFTSGNNHNQASLALVDRELTERLNRERNVDVRMPR